ncbi:MAG TPA: RHS repeat-associated core domain-containing protein, partial [Flavobacteriales bacterium]|nr:RHS repeat-associated core domain-containing protein [Flavobacteriales bacterium]
ASPYEISHKTQTISYTAFLKPGRIEEEVNNHPYKLEYEYGPELQRTRSVLQAGGMVVNTRVYLGDYEVQEVNGVVQQIHYIQGGDGLCAMIVQDGVQLNTYATYLDHLGSIVALTDASTGHVAAEQNFDAWGRHRDPADWNPTYTTLLPSWLYRGFTGHEHVEPFGLINMNARMYDPLNGRMLSADNYVNGTSATQAFNRYSYAGNNPLTFADPSGNYVHLIVGAIVGGVINWATHGAEFNAEGLGYFGVGAVAGALAAGVGAGVSSALAGGGFGAGFIGSSSAMVAASGFTSGAVVGGSAGFFGGFITTTGNALITGQKSMAALEQGLRGGLQAAVGGAFMGGVIGGLDAVHDERNFWSGNLPDKG